MPYDCTPLRWIDRTLLECRTDTCIHGERPSFLFVSAAVKTAEMCFVRAWSFEPLAFSTLCSLLRSPASTCCQLKKALTRGRTDHFSNKFPPVTLNFNTWPWHKNLTQNGSRWTTMSNVGQRSFRAIAVIRTHRHTHTAYRSRYLDHYYSDRWK